ncbi:ECF-type sigma factor [Edaphobacter bradus]|uniref:ECF-type sigma factor n=1 Tax=Edaphobacter bradus TaxID=2259016 RepID=UPI0021E0ABF6|nr:ECF-type sigma factor [Edaphobacter bradus]
MSARLDDSPKSQPSPPSPREAALSTTLYQELHRLAVRKMHYERGGHTLQPTALVNEAYLRLADCYDSVCKDRAKLLGMAAHVMRHILVDHARAHRADKRGGGAVQITFDENLEVAGRSGVDVLAVDEALTRLAEFDPRQARILELHFFAGLTFEEIALQLGVSERTVKRDWTMARAWLRQELAPMR